jgi:hypothetical protein
MHKIPYYGPYIYEVILNKTTFLLDKIEIGSRPY